MGSVVTRIHSFRSREELTHRALAGYNAERFTPALPTSHDEDRPAAYAFKQLELDLMEHERARIADAVAEVPENADAFMEWFEGLREHGPGQFDPLFDWLAEDATLDEMRWFLKQEVAGEAGFDDLVALTQIKMPPRVKLEMARNYWDEMGQGHASGMHGPMLDRLARELSLDDVPGEVVWEALAVSNVMIALATRRRFAYGAAGALGVIELTAPDRAERVNAGLKRLGVSGEARRYFALHATLDKKHAAAWNAEVLRPLVEEDPQRARPIAEGALLRLGAGARSFRRYRQELRLV